MERIIKFTPEEEAFRKIVGEFVEKEVAPKFQDWYKRHITYEEQHELFRKMNEIGAVCPDADPKYGGQGKSWIYNVIVSEEFAIRGFRGASEYLHNSVSYPYFYDHTTDEQKERWFPDIISGKTLCVIAMTEPEAGSDLGSLKTKAVKDGDQYIINGEKIFCTGGMTADLFMIATKVDGDERGKITLFGVPADTPGLTREVLEQELYGVVPRTRLYFKDMRVPAKNMLGEQGKGFSYMMEGLQQERLIVAIAGISNAERALNITIDRVKEREQFGKPIGKNQYIQFEMADLATRVAVFRPFVDALILAHLTGKNVVKEVSMAKLFGAELQQYVVGRCRQIWGGYGLTAGYEIWQMYKDIACESIFAGTSEVMKTLISREILK